MSRLCPAIERELREVGVKRERELALSRSEDRFKRLVEQAADAIFVHDLEGRFVDVNRQACESLGYSREELPYVRRGRRGGPRTRLAAGVVEAGRLGPASHAGGHHRRKDGSSSP